MDKELLLKCVLRLAAVGQIGYWSVSHLFFPCWYLESIGMTDLAAHPGAALVFVNEIGILSLGVGLLTWLAATDPIARFHDIVVLYVVGLGSAAVSLGNILLGRIPPGEWLTVVLILSQLILVSVLYPWGAWRRNRAARTS